jgi:hypothetical protein
MAGRRSKGRAKSDDAVPTQQLPTDELAACCPDMEQWPKSWMYEERDLSSGQRMVDCFKPFLRHLLDLNPSHKTFRKHRDNLWLLGGEIVSHLHETPGLRNRPIKQIVFAALDEEGGPFIAHKASEDQQRSFDSTCRKLYRFLKPKE